VVEQHGRKDVVSKRRSAPYRSYRPGECRDWRKIKTVARRKANRERKALRRLLHRNRDVRVGSTSDENCARAAP